MELLASFLLHLPLTSSPWLPSPSFFLIVSLNISYPLETNLITIYTCLSIVMPPHPQNTPWLKSNKTSYPCSQRIFIGVLDQSSMCWTELYGLGNQGPCFHRASIPVGKMNHKQIHVNKPDMFIVKSYTNPLLFPPLCSKCYFPEPHFSTPPSTSCYLLPSAYILAFSSVGNVCDSFLLCQTYLLFKAQTYLLFNSPPMWVFNSMWLSLSRLHYISNLFYGHFFLCICPFFFSRESLERRCYSMIAKSPQCFKPLASPSKLCNPNPIPSRGRTYVTCYYTVNR